jgi:hypothetical protein
MNVKVRIGKLLCKKTALHRTILGFRIDSEPFKVLFVYS